MNRSKVRTAAGTAMTFAVLVGLGLPVHSVRLNASESGDSQGGSLFKSKCLMCHGADGSGNTPIGKALKIVDLRSAEVQKQSNAQFASVISHGKGKMPAFGGGLSKAQINDLVAFIRSLAKKK